MLLNHSITYKDEQWILDFSINQSEILPKECLLTRNGKFIDVCNIEDFKNGTPSFIRVSAIELKFIKLDDAVKLKNEMVNKLSTLKEQYENLMFSLRDDSTTKLKF